MLSPFGWVATIIGAVILAFIIFVSILYGAFYNLYWLLGFTIIGFGLFLIIKTLLCGEVLV